MNEALQVIKTFWPLIALQFVLTIAALISIARRKETRHLPNWAWVLIVLFINFIGPIAYFAVGRGELRDE